MTTSTVELERIDQLPGDRWRTYLVEPTGDDRWPPRRWQVVVPTIDLEHPGRFAAAAGEQLGSWPRIDYRGWSEQVERAKSYGDRLDGRARCQPADPAAWRCRRCGREARLAMRAWSKLPAARRRTPGAYSRLAALVAQIETGPHDSGCLAKKGRAVAAC